MKRFSVLFVECLLVFICGYVICNSEKFQAFIAPEKFWTIKAKALEEKLKILKYKLTATEINLEKLKHERNFAIRQAMHKAKAFDLNVVNEISQIEKKYDQKQHIMEEEVKHLRISLINQQVSLASTYTELDCL